MFKVLTLTPTLHGHNSYLTELDPPEAKNRSIGFPEYKESFSV